MSPVTFLVSRFNKLGLSASQTDAVMREVAGFLFRPSRMRIRAGSPLRKKTDHRLAGGLDHPSYVNRLIMCDEVVDSCTHCWLAWELLTYVRRSPSKWSMFWDDIEERRRENLTKWWATLEMRRQERREARVI